MTTLSKIQDLVGKTLRISNNIGYRYDVTIKFVVLGKQCTIVCEYDQEGQMQDCEVNVEPAELKELAVQGGALSKGLLSMEIIND